MFRNAALGSHHDATPKQFPSAAVGQHHDAAPGQHLGTVPGQHLGTVPGQHPGAAAEQYPGAASSQPRPTPDPPPFRIEPTISQHCLGGPPRSPETKNRSELQLFCDWQLLRTPQSRIAAQKRSKKWHISRLKEPRRAPNRKKVAKIPSFLFFVMGPIAATGQIPRKRAEYHDQQPKIRNKKGARYADASRKTNSAEIYASLAPYCS